jgi:general secretion pathway protein D
VIDKIDRVAEQVMIETIIVEANLDKTTKLGVEWNFLRKGIFNSSKASDSGSQGFGLQSASPALEGLTYTIGNGAYKAFVNALQTDTRFKVLDTPRIFTSNNVKAVINVSQKIPYITSQQTGIVGGLISNYQFQDVGVVLTVTPRITSSGQVTMDVDQSADDLQGFTSFNAPIINHRQATTTVSINNGETIILGGIIRNTLTQTENKIPILGDIPFFGNLFKSSSRTAGQTELMVFLTPHIVRSNADAQKLREASSKEMSKQSQDALKHLIPPPPGP